MKSPSRLFLFIILLGISLRIVIMLFSFQFRENTDVLRWRDWGRIAYLHTLADTYKTDYLTFGTLPNNMPPGTLYIASSMYRTAIYTSRIVLKITNTKEGSLQWINGPLLNGFLRLPSLLADCLIAFFIYTVVKNNTTEKRALIGSSLFFFNPVVIYNSSFWGQMDSLNNLFFFISLFFILKRRITLAIIFYFLSLYIKFSLLFALPFIFVLLFKLVNNNLSKSLLLLSTGLGTVILLTLFITTNPILWIFNYLIKNSTGEMQNITAFAFNFWWVIYKPTVSIGNMASNFSFSEIRLLSSPLSQDLLFGIPLTAWAFLAFFIAATPLSLLLSKQSITNLLPTKIFLYFALLSLIAFLFLPRMHERYMYPVFPLLACYIGLMGRKFTPFYIVLSFLNTINLYYVWHPSLPPLIPYALMTNNLFQWLISVITVCAGVLFYVKSLRELLIYDKK